MGTESCKGDSVRLQFRDDGGVNIEAFIPLDRLVDGREFTAEDLELVFRDPTLRERVLVRSMLVRLGHPEPSNKGIASAGFVVYLLQPRLSLIEAAIRLVEAAEEGNDLNVALAGIEVGMKSLDTDAGRTAVELLSGGAVPTIHLDFYCDPTRLHVRLRDVYLNFSPGAKKVLDRLS